MSRKGARWISNELKRLIRLVQHTGIGELEVTAGGRTMRICARPRIGGRCGGCPYMMGGARQRPRPPQRRRRRRRWRKPAGERRTRISWPSSRPWWARSIGRLRRTPIRTSRSGDAVEVGQTVCIIEAMKLMNEIESEVKGRVVQILVENAQPVEFGQKLFLIDPS